MHKLEPLEPSNAVEMYLEDREQDGTADWTIYGHGSRLSRFIEWCDEDDIDNLNDLGPRDLRRYKIWRGEYVSRVTLASQLDTLRVFIGWCEEMDAVRPDLSEAVQYSSLSKGEDVRTVMLTHDTATDILAYYRKYNYATPPHIMLEIMVHTAIRRYALTRPCVYSDCPHDRDVSECDAAQRRNDASKCPSSVSPHAIRRGAITHWLNNDMPRPIAGDRANVSEKSRHLTGQVLSVSGGHNL